MPVANVKEVRDFLGAHIDDDNIFSLADGFRALADETRLRMIGLLIARGEICVCEFIQILDLTQSNVSFHLKTLKYAGFITSRKEGKWMYYSLKRKAFEVFQANFRGMFDPDNWPEQTEHASCENDACKQTKCK